MNGDSDTEGGTEPGTVDPGSTGPDPSGESSESSASGESTGDDVPEPAAWCIEVAYPPMPEPLDGAFALLDVDGDGTPQLWASRSRWAPVDELFTASFHALAFDGSDTSPSADFQRGGRLVSTADIDGDGRTDAIMSAEPGADAYFLRGGADGDFGVDPTPIDVDPALSGALIDINGDTRADQLRVVAEDYEFATVEFLIGDGAGVFAATGTVVVPSGVRTLKMIAPDLLLIDVEGPWCDFCVPPTGLTVVQIGASGEPTVVGQVEPDLSRRFLDAADHNGDGLIDLLVLSSDNDQPIGLQWLDSDGDGGYVASAPIEGVNADVVGDFDLDGATDLIDGTSVRWGIEGEGLSEPEPVRGAPPSSEFSGAADLDGDGALDIVARWAGAVWTLVPCDDAYVPPDEPLPPVEPTCGDGVVDAHEECDGGPGCRGDCVLEASVLWSSTYAGDGLNDCAQAVGVAPTGEIYATGFVRTADDGRELFVVGLDADGNERWSDRYNATAGNDGDEGTGIAVAPGGDVYVSGNVFDTLLWLRRYTPDGDEVWTEQAGSLEVEIGSANALTLAADGLPVVVGEAEGAAWIGKFDATGAMLWDATQPADDAAFDQVERDAEGNFLAIGWLGSAYSGRAVVVAVDALGGSLWRAEGEHEFVGGMTGVRAEDGRTVLAQRDRWAEDGDWVLRLVDDTGAGAGAASLYAEDLRDVYGMTSAPDGDLIVVGDRDGRGFAQRMALDGDVRWDRTFGDGELHDAVVDSDGSIVVTGCNNGQAIVRRIAGDA